MPDAPQSAEPVEVFYSYSHKDEKLREKLDNHLSLLRRQGLINGWNDRDIEAGADWEREISEHLNRAPIILLLISDDFIASEYCYCIEMERALERHERGEARVIPVILRPVDWESGPFGKLQALPKGGKPVVKWSNRDDAFKDIAQGIRKIIGHFKPKYPASPHIPRPPAVGFVARRDAQGANIVGRLGEEFASQKARLVTLSGPGGVGKTTLAAEAARSLADMFGGRVVWSGAGGRAGYTLSALLDDIAAQLGRADLRALAPDLKKGQVRALVADRPSLVVLDNYETVAPDEQRGIEDWFEQSACAALITSREKVARTLNVVVAAMSRQEARELLEKLIAQAQDPEVFSEAVRERVYETAEANPFLMEWVVAQIDAAQEPRAVLEELKQGEGDAAERVFGRSFNLPQVGDDGRAALLALSLFTPSASRPALAAAAGFGADEKRLNEAVKSLRALWLIKVFDENRRFAIEGLTRSLAGSRLSNDERAGEFRRRFALYFLEYAHAHAQPTPEDYDALEAEKDNLLGAVDAAVFYEDWQAVLALAQPLPQMLNVRGYWDDTLRLYQQALEAARLSQDEQWASVISNDLGALCQSRGEIEEARRLYHESLNISKKLDNQGLIAVTLHQLGWLAQAEGEMAEARRLFGESLDIKRKLDDQIGIASTLHQLGWLAQAEGEMEEARRLYGDSLDISRGLGDQNGMAATLLQLGGLANLQGDVEEARRLYDESLDIRRKLGDRNGIAIILLHLGGLAQYRSDMEEARRLYGESLDISRRLGDRSGVASALCLLGVAHLILGEYEEARAKHEESLAIRRKLGEQKEIADDLQQLGMLAELDGNKEEAARMLREALDIRERLGSPFAEVARQSLARVERRSSLYWAWRILIKAFRDGLKNSK